MIMAAITAQMVVILSAFSSSFSLLPLLPRLDEGLPFPDELFLEGPGAGLSSMLRGLFLPLPLEGRSGLSSLRRIVLSRSSLVRV